MGKIDISRFAITGTQDIAEPQETSTVKNSTENSNPLKQSYSNTWGIGFEKVDNISLSNLSHYADGEGNSQPFKINEEKINQIMKSAEDVGIINPLIVRKSEGSTYQIIAGHHRYEAAKRLKHLTVPCIIRNISDNDVFQIIAESNIQRDKTLPSEYGKIFAAYMDKRSDVEITAQEIADKFGISKRNMYRYINVSRLIPDLQTYVDEGKILLAAVDKICEFTENNQRTLAKVFENPDIKKKLSPALASKLAEVVEHYEGDDVPYHEFSWFFIAAPKAQRKYKRSIYNNLSSRFQIDKSEDELDVLAEKLLTEYFQAQNNGEEV